MLVSVPQLYARMNSTSTLLGILRGVVFMNVILLAENPQSAAASFHSSRMSVGITIDIFPSLVSSSDAFLKNCSQPSVSLCRASVRAVSLHLRLLTK